jgi:hypothetical protein
MRASTISAQMAAAKVRQNAVGSVDIVLQDSNMSSKEDPQRQSSGEDITVEQSTVDHG